MTNASLPTIFAGLKPRIRQVLRGREYFQFHNGQVRRQIGQGHSTAERRARTQAAQQIRSLVWSEKPVRSVLAGSILLDLWNRKEPPFAGPHIFLPTLAR